MKVVIADDNMVIANGISELIKNNFPELIVDGVFYSGAALMDYLDKQIPDILISDIRMPKFSGLDAAKKIREVSSFAQIIMLTGYKEFEYAKQAIDFNVQKLITKPYDNEVLVSAIASSLSLLIAPLTEGYIHALKTITIRDFILRYQDEIDALTKVQVISLLTEAQNTFHTSQDLESCVKPSPKETLLCFAESYFSSNPQMLLVKNAKLYIRNNFSNPSLSLTMVAEHLSISSAYLSNLFKKESNIGLNDYITKIRVDNAKTLLLNNELSAKEIAEQTGFASQKYFTFIFKEHVGMTPTQYRREKSHEENQKPFNSQEDT